MERKIYYLYLIRDLLSEKIYVGQTVRPKERWSQHKAYAKHNKPAQYIHRAMAKYGVDNFQFETIASCLSQEDVDLTEVELIKQYDSQNKEHGYNVAPGGDHAWNAGLPSEQQPMYGKKQSDFQKQRMSEIHAGSTKPAHTQEWKDNMSYIMTGRIMSDEWKNKIGKGRRGKLHTEKTKKILSDLKIGKKLNQETKNKISIANKNVSRNTGELCGNSKLTWTIVSQIRAEFAVGNISKNKLAKKYGVSQPSIKNIILNITWKI